MSDLLKTVFLFLDCVPTRPAYGCWLEGKGKRDDGREVSDAEETEVEDAV